MPLAILPLIATFLGSIVAGLAFRILASLGFAYVTYQGINFLINNTKSYIVGLFSSLPPEIAAILGMAKVDIAVNIIIAAVIARLMLSGLSQATGTITALMLSKG
jgi:hypothetical protein